MSQKGQNTGFICENCGFDVQPLTNGSYRNHCPSCLYSKHVDNLPGDRNCSCYGLMKPIGIKYKPAKGYQIIHLCNKCGETRTNKIADNTIQSDEIERILALFK